MPDRLGAETTDLDELRMGTCGDDLVDRRELVVLRAEECAVDRSGGDRTLDSGARWCFERCLFVCT